MKPENLSIKFDQGTDQKILLLCPVSSIHLLLELRERIRKRICEKNREFERGGGDESAVWEIKKQIER